VRQAGDLELDFEPEARHFNGKFAGSALRLSPSHRNTNDRGAPARDPFVYLNFQNSSELVDIDHRLGTVGVLAAAVAVR
jgi:hypothetical protein